MFSRLWRRNQIILCAISGGSLEKLAFWIFLGVFRIFGRVFLVFLGVFRVFWGCSGFFGGVPGFWVFRDVPGCSGVPVFRVPVFLEVLHAISDDISSLEKRGVTVTKNVACSGPAPRSSRASFRSVPTDWEPGTGYKKCKKHHSWCR